MLSLGRFDIETDLTLNNSIRESLRYDHLIGPSDDNNDLTQYSNQLLLRYFNEQIVTFPNSRYVLQS